MNEKNVTLEQDAPKNGGGITQEPKRKKSYTKPEVKVEKIEVNQSIADCNVVNYQIVAKRWENFGEEYKIYDSEQEARAGTTSDEKFSYPVYEIAVSTTYSYGTQSGSFYVQDLNRNSVFDDGDGGQGIGGSLPWDVFNVNDGYPGLARAIISHGTSLDIGSSKSVAIS